MKVGAQPRLAAPNLCGSCLPQLGHLPAARAGAQVRGCHLPAPGARGAERRDRSDRPRWRGRVTRAGHHSKEPPPRPTAHSHRAPGKPVVSPDGEKSGAPCSPASLPAPPPPPAAHWGARSLACFLSSSSRLTPGHGVQMQAALYFPASLCVSPPSFPDGRGPRCFPNLLLRGRASWWLAI